MSYQLNSPLTTLARCPQCGTARPTLNLQSIVRTRQVEWGVPQSWAVYQCTSCDDIVCFKGGLPLSDEQASTEEYLQYESCAVDHMMPSPPEEDFSDWPERARRYMVQAIDAVGAPDGAIMLAGSAVDAMLKAKELTEGTVYARIEEAVRSNLLTPAMGQWAHAVRLSANNPRHADLDDPHATIEEAKAVIDFVKALAQFLFVLPARIERGREDASRAAQDPAEA